MTLSNDPPVSVVVPAYNAAWCVRRAIDSVLAQESVPLELIVVDDGSTDETLSVLAEYGDRLRVVSKINGGLSSARNAGIKAARGQYVAFLDADDWWLPGKLARQVDTMRLNPELVFCSTAANLVAADGRALGEWKCAPCAGSALEAIFSANAHVAGSGSAVLARRNAFDQAGGFDEKLRSLEDIDMWMRLAALGEFTCIGEPLVMILKRPESMSGNLEVMRTSAIAVMRKNRCLLPAGRRGAFWRRPTRRCFPTTQMGMAQRTTRSTIGRSFNGFSLAHWRGRLMIDVLPRCCSSVIFDDERRNLAHYRAHLHTIASTC